MITPESVVSFTLVPGKPEVAEFLVAEHAIKKAKNNKVEVFFIILILIDLFQSKAAYDLLKSFPVLSYCIPVIL